MTKLLNPIVVGTKEYDLLIIDDNTFDYVLASKSIYDDDIKAFIDYDEQLIFVRSRISCDQRHELIIHEILHAALEDAGVEQTDETERLIHVLSPRINSLLKNNNFVKILNHA